MKKIVIIGGVAGGASCAARLRRLNEDIQIILLERGNYISYANCGLPYHVGDVIKKQDSLLVQTPVSMTKKFNLDVRVNNEVTEIHRSEKFVTVKNTLTGEIYQETYDNLVIATGSSPVKPPIPGINSDKIHTLWTINDTEKIRSLIKAQNISSAAIIGGGFIGLEMAENLHRIGINVSLIEAGNQVMAPLDFEMAQLLHEDIVKNNVQLYLNDGVTAFEDTNDGISITLSSGKTVSAEFVILAIGVRPNSELAKAAGLEVNARQAIVTDASLKTNDPDIYAIGDVIEVEDFITKDRTMIPLAGPANKQGRIAADNILGLNKTYHGTQGTSVAHIFDLTAATTGLNEKNLNQRGLVKGQDYETVIIRQSSHATYYPGAQPIFLKLIFSMDGQKIYGAQAVGCEGVDKRIDVLAASIRLGASIDDLTNLELAYAPPYSSAKDPINMAAYTAENVLAKRMVLASWDEIETHPDSILIDVRSHSEFEANPSKNSKLIPIGSLRSHMHELDPEKSYVLVCVTGVRSYYASRILLQNGFKNVKVYPGGFKFYQSTHYTTL